MGTIKPNEPTTSKLSAGSVCTFLNFTRTRKLIISICDATMYNYIISIIYKQLTIPWVMLINYDVTAQML
ncbi:MAG: hypothetical protein ABL876_00085 [Chitinophagaceae bacterium]